MGWLVEVSQLGVFGFRDQRDRILLAQLNTLDIFTKKKELEKEEKNSLSNLYSHGIYNNK